MREALLSISGIVGSPWTALVLVGLTIGVMYTALLMIQVNPSPLNARTTGETTSPDGSWNWNVRLLTQEEISAWLSTKNTEQQIQKNSTPLSHSGC